MDSPKTPSLTLSDHNPEDWLTLREVAGELRVSEGTFRSWIRKGKGPNVYWVGGKHGTVRFKAGDVLSWLEAQSRDAR